MRGGPVAVHAAQDVWVWYLRVYVGVRIMRLYARACACMRARASALLGMWVCAHARVCLCACARVLCVGCVSVQRPIAWRADLGHRKDTCPTSAWWAPPTAVGGTRCACSLFAVGSDASRSRSDGVREDHRGDHVPNEVG